MSEQIKKFLEAEDLDDLQRTKEELGDLDDQDITLICSTLKQWNPVQALSNLLFHPVVIPSAIRIEVILKALTDHQNPYIVLAAIVGLQDIDIQQISEEERDCIVMSLLEIMKNNETILADRASVSILPLLSKREMEKVFRLMSHPSVTTCHNLLGWLYREVANENLTEFMKMAEQAKIPPETREKVAQILDEDEKMKTRGLPSLLGSHLYSYIPNRKEI